MAELAKGASVVMVGCKLPNGIILSHPKHPKFTVTLAGVHSSKIIGATYAITEVDAEFWKAWKAANAEFTPFKTNAIFEGSTRQDVADMAGELEKEKTGLEPLSRETLGVTKATV